MAIFNCKSCGGDLEIKEGTTVVTCEYCGRQQTVPSMDNEKKVNLFNRANRLRSKCDFDKAASVYESIVAEFPQESEAYWGLCLCKFGIEYVDDPSTANKIPTCHRTSYESIFDDQNFDMACENADALAVNQLRSEAKEIDRLQKEILEIAKNEQPFDVFICYKESDESGKRTVDSELAHDIYDVLTEKGYKVFYSRITLKAKLGQDYEPYIFSALNSAKVMLSIGTKYEYFNAVWVKNEWSRFLSLMKSDKSKMLIPCYRDIDPYDMPKEFSGLQGQDLSSPRAFQDLVTNIEKIIPRANTSASAAAMSNVPATDPLIKRAYICLEDGDWSGADKCCEKILDLNPENFDAYFVKFFVDIKAHNINEIVNSGKPIDETNTNFQRALKFGNESQKQQLEGINKSIFYNSCVLAMEAAKDEYDFGKAAEMFKQLGGFKDSKELFRLCAGKAADVVNERLYQEAIKLKEKAEDYEAASVYDEAAEAFESISGYRDSAELAAQCKNKAETIDIDRRYRSVCSLMRGATDKESYLAAQSKFLELGDYKDSAQLAEQCRQRAEEVQEEFYAEMYNSALEAIGKDDITSLESALESLNSIKGYKDSEELFLKCEKRLDKLKLIADATSAANAKKRKRRNIIIAVSSAAAGITAVVMIILTAMVFIPKSKYNAAAALEESGNYDDAILAFNDLNIYSDARERAVTCQYKKALELFHNGKHSEAVYYFNEALRSVNSDAFSENYREQLYQNVCGAIDSLDDHKKAVEIYNTLYDLPNHEEKANESCYKHADERAAAGDYREAGVLFESISGYSDSDNRASENYYKFACELFENGDIKNAQSYFEKSKNYSGSSEKINEMYYSLAEKELADGNYKEAVELFLMVPSYSDSRSRALECCYTQGDLLYKAKEYEKAAEYYKLAGDNGGDIQKYYDCYNALATQCYNSGNYSDAFNYWEKAGVGEAKKLEIYEKAVDFVDRGEEEEAAKLFNVLGYYKDSSQYLELCNTWISLMNGQTSMRDAKNKFSQLYDQGLNYYGSRYVNSPEFTQLNYYLRNYEDKSQLTTNAYVGWLTNPSTGDFTGAFVISSDGLSLKYYTLSGQIVSGNSQWSSLFLGVRNGMDIPIYLDGGRRFVNYSSTLNYSGSENGRLYLEFGYDNQSNRQTLTVGDIPFYLYSFRHTQSNGGIPIDVPIY